MKPTWSWSMVTISTLNWLNTVEGAAFTPSWNVSSQNVNITAGIWLDSILCRHQLFSHKSGDKTRKLLLFFLTILELLSLLCNFEKRSNGDRMGWSTGMFRSVRWLSSSWFLSLNALDSSQACSIQLTIPNISGINNVSLEDHLDAWAGVVWNIFVW